MTERAVIGKSSSVGVPSYCTVVLEDTLPTVLIPDQDEGKCGEPGTVE